MIPLPSQRVAAQSTPYPETDAKNIHRQALLPKLHSRHLYKEVLTESQLTTTPPHRRAIDVPITMRVTLRLLAAVKPARYLTPNTPTGLTGLFTHPAPRSALLYLYSSTLDKLGQLPEDSVYRKATEALTKQRLEIVEAVKPEGFEAWQQRVRKVVETHPDVFERGGGYKQGKHVRETKGGVVFVTSTEGEVYDELLDEWDGEKDTGGELEGTRSEAERASQADLGEDRPLEETKTVELEAEPALTADQ